MFLEKPFYHGIYTVSTPKSSQRANAYNLSNILYKHGAGSVNVSTALVIWEHTVVQLPDLYVAL